MKYIARVTKRVSLDVCEAEKKHNKSIEETSPFPVGYFIIFDDKVMEEVDDCVFEECTDEFYKKIIKDLESLYGKKSCFISMYGGYRIIVENEKLLMEMETNLRLYEQSYFLVVHHGNDEHTVYLECEEGSELPELALQYSDAEVKEVYMDIK